MGAPGAPVGGVNRRKERLNAETEKPPRGRGIARILPFPG